ncbi:MAG: DUF5362 family protein [Saprospiraceae bacterium]|nr:hypothetical protein [Lewinella sp.]
MESQIIDDSFESTLSDQMRLYIKEIASWSFFLSIVGFVFIGFMVLFGLFAGVILSSIMGNEMMGMMGMMGPGLMSGLYLVLALVYFFPVFYLFRFSSKAKTALRTGDDTELTVAFENLKSHYKFMGILTIVIISLYFLIFLFGIVGGMMM